MIRRFRAFVARLLDLEDPEIRRLGVEAMNRYIGRTERYIAALETELEGFGADLAEIREFHGRSDQRDLLTKVKAWGIR